MQLRKALALGAAGTGLAAAIAVGPAPIAMASHTQQLTTAHAATAAGVSPRSAGRPCGSDVMYLNNEMEPGDCLESRDGSYVFVFDKGGHAIFIRRTPHKHCASWPAPGDVHSKAHLRYIVTKNPPQAYFVLYVDNPDHPYARVNGSIYYDQGYPDYWNTTLSISGGQLWVGATPVHGCG